MGENILVKLAGADDQPPNIRKTTGHTRSMARGASSSKMEGDVGETEVPRSREIQDINTEEEAETTGGEGEDGGSVGGAQGNLGDR